MSSPRRSNRNKTRPQRFDKETKHLHPSFGGSAGANNGHTAGRNIDVGHDTWTTWDAYACNDCGTIGTVSGGEFYDEKQAGIECQKHGCYSANVDEVFLPDTLDQHGEKLERARYDRALAQQLHSESQTRLAMVHPKPSLNYEPRRVGEVAKELADEANAKAIDNPVMKIVRKLNGTAKGQCVGYKCGKMLTDSDKDHALCNACWDMTFNSTAPTPPHPLVDAAAYQGSLPLPDPYGFVRPTKAMQSLEKGTRASSPDEDDMDILQELKKIHEQQERSSGPRRRRAYEEACFRENGTRFLFSPKPIMNARNGRYSPLCQNEPLPLPPRPKPLPPPPHFGYMVEHHSIENGQSVVIWAWEAASLEQAKKSAREALDSFQTPYDYYEICKIISPTHYEPVWAGNCLLSLA